MDQNTLYITWLNGQFEAMAPMRGGPPACWSSPTPTDDLAQFKSLLDQACRQTRFRGTNVVMALAHPRLTHQLVNIPPVKGYTLDLFIQRRLQKLKTFDSDAAWSYQPTLQTKTGGAVLLHLFPQTFLTGLLRTCEQANLKLVKVLPFPDLILSNLKNLPLQSNQVGVLAADTGTMTTAVVGRKDGSMLLARALNGSWNTDADRLGTDLNRTILFVKQQFGVTVDGVWAFGKGAEKALALQPTLNIPVSESPVPHQRFYWAATLAKLGRKEGHNLVSREVLIAPRRKKVLQFSSVLAVALALMAIATAVGVQIVVAGQKSTMANLQPRIGQLEKRKVDLEKRQAAFDVKKSFVEEVLQTESQPVANWFLAYMGQTVPEDLLLHSLHVRRHEKAWSVQLDGGLRPLGAHETNAVPSTLLGNAVAQFTNSLVHGPFHVHLSNCNFSQPEPTEEPEAGGTFASIINALRKDRAPRKETTATVPKNTFAMEGSLQ